MAAYNVHAGHAPVGTGGAVGAVGLLNESYENRIVKNYVIKLLRQYGNTVYDCTCDLGLNQVQVLNYIVANCNRNRVNLDISIHLNSGRNDYGGDGSTGGVEVYGYNMTQQEIGSRICENISKILNIQNRGYKTNKNLYVLSATKSPAILIECCFVDDKDDALAWDARKCAAAIVSGILNLTNEEVEEKIIGVENNNVQNDNSPQIQYRVHMKDIGWGDFVHNGEIAGTVGESRRIEAINIDYQGQIKAKVHLANIGWNNYGIISKDTILGTVGQNRQIECLCLEGNFEYRVHIQYYGWSAWTKADGIVTLGTVGKSLSLEAIQIKLLS